MRIVEQTSDRLVLRQSPWMVRIIGIVTALCSSVVVGGMTAAGERGNHAFWILALLVFSGMACAGLVAALVAVDRCIVLDRVRKTVQLSRRGGLNRPRVTELPFSEISDVALEVTIGSAQANGMAGYRIAFVLRDGSTLPWTALATSDVGTQSTCAAAARAFGGWDTTGARSAAASTDVTRPTPAPWVAALRPTPRSAAVISAATTPPRVAIVMVFLGVIAVAGALATLVQLEQLVTWRKAPARVVASRIDPVRGAKGGTTYRPVITYTYRVGDRTYSSSTVTVFLESRSWSWASGIANQYRPGASTVAYVSPKNPRRAFLVHDLSPFPLVIVAVVVGFATLVSRSVHWQRRQLAIAATAPVPIIAQRPAVRSRAA